MSTPTVYGTGHTIAWYRTSPDKIEKGEGTKLLPTEEQFPVSLQHPLHKEALIAGTINLISTVTLGIFAAFALSGYIDVPPAGIYLCALSAAGANALFLIYGWNKTRPIIVPVSTDYLEKTISPEELLLQNTQKHLEREKIRYTVNWYADSLSEKENFSLKKTLLLNNDICSQTIKVLKNIEALFQEKMKNLEKSSQNEGEKLTTRICRVLNQLYGALSSRTIFVVDPRINLSDSLKYTLKTISRHLNRWAKEQAAYDQFLSWLTRQENAPRLAHHLNDYISGTVSASATAGNQATSQNSGKGKQRSQNDQEGSSSAVSFPEKPTVRYSFIKLPNSKTLIGGAAANTVSSIILTTLFCVSDDKSFVLNTTSGFTFTISMLALNTFLHYYGAYKTTPREIYLNTEQAQQSFTYSSLVKATKRGILNLHFHRAALHKLKDSILADSDPQFVQISPQTTDQFPIALQDIFMHFRERKNLTNQALKRAESALQNKYESVLDTISTSITRRERIKTRTSKIPSVIQTHFSSIKTELKNWINADTELKKLKIQFLSQYEASRSPETPATSNGHPPLPPSPATPLPVAARRSGSDSDEPPIRSASRRSRSSRKNRRTRIGTGLEDGGAPGSSGGNGFPRSESFRGDSFARRRDSPPRQPTTAEASYFVSREQEFASPSQAAFSSSFNGTSFNLPTAEDMSPLTDDDSFIPAEQKGSEDEPGPSDERRRPLTTPRRSPFSGKSGIAILAASEAGKVVYRSEKKEKENRKERENGGQSDTKRKLFSFRSSGNSSKSGK